MIKKAILLNFIKKFSLKLYKEKRSDNPYPNSQKMKEILEQLNEGQK